MSLKLPDNHIHKDGRHCTTCKEFKPASEFKLEARPNSRYKDGINMRSKCKTCDELRKYKRFIQKTYGISWNDFQELLVKQDNKCAICKSEDNKNKRAQRLFVDHDHKTGKVRGLLCSKCNHGIGHFDDDAEVLYSAANYLISSKE